MMVKKILVCLLVLAMLCGVISGCAKKELTPEELLSLGEKYLADLDYENAAVQFLKVIEIDPMNARAYQGAAKAYRALGQTENEVAQYLKLIEIDQKNIQAYISAAEAYKALKQPQNAVAQYLKIIEIEPNNIQAYLETVELYNELGQPENTVAQYLKLIKLEPSNSRYYYSLAKTYIVLEQPESAVAQYIKVIEIEPDNVETYLLLAELYIKLEQPENAISQFLKVIELEPSDVESNLSVAELYVELDQPANAAEHYLKVIELEPDNEQMYLIVADLYTTLKQNDKAIVILTKGVEATDDDELKARIDALKPQPAPVVNNPAPKPTPQPVPQPAPQPVPKATEVWEQESDDEEWTGGEVAAGKPVIYLYPEEKMDVSVKVNLKNVEFSSTYPEYGNGWDVIAFPDGKIINKKDNKEYSYLFWEAEGKVDYDMSKGFVVKGSDTASFLQEKLSYMGLTPKEYNEFIVYWMPLMQNNPYNLISFQSERYTDIAELAVSPKPDSVLRVFMVYQPLEKPITVPEQKLSKFTRKGFTVVEWGGTCKSGRYGETMVIQ